jgi:hypothetical protein
VKVINDNIAFYLEEAPDPAANSTAVRDNSKLGPLFKSTVPAFVEGYKLPEDDAAIMKEMWPEGEDKAAEVRCLGMQSVYPPNISPAGFASLPYHKSKILSDASSKPCQRRSG